MAHWKVNLLQSDFQNRSQKIIWQCYKESKAFSQLGYMVHESGNINEESNPNGSLQNIAGIFNKQKNVLGMMPHPERMIDPALSGEDGSIFFENLINNLK